MSVRCNVLTEPDTNHRCSKHQIFTKRMCASKRPGGETLEALWSPSIPKMVRIPTSDHRMGLTPLTAAQRRSHVCHTPGPGCLPSVGQLEVWPRCRPWYDFFIHVACGAHSVNTLSLCTIPFLAVLGVFPLWLEAVTDTTLGNPLGPVFW